MILPRTPSPRPLGKPWTCPWHAITAIADATVEYFCLNPDLPQAPPRTPRQRQGECTIFGKTGRRDFPAHERNLLQEALAETAGPEQAVGETREQRTMELEGVALS